MNKSFRRSFMAFGLITVALFALALSRPQAAQVTFTKDVAPLLYKHCAECHRPGEIAPMSLMSYQEARPWAKAIKERVVEGSMPPWSADPNVGHWANDPRLLKQEIDTIVAWANAGAPKGDDKDLPPAPKFTTGWTIGQPDVVFEMKDEYTVPADGTIPYLYFTIPTNFTEDKWIQAMEIRPGSRSVVHHVIAFTTEGGSSGIRGESEARGQLGGITPNKTGVTFAPGSARLIKQGSNIVFQMHYTTNGAVTKDRTRIAFVFAKEPAKRELVTGNAINTRFVIPAGDGNYEVKASKTFTEDVAITSFMPHMHVRGKDFVYTVVYPDGRSEVLLNVPKYDFNWQHTYIPKEPIRLPKGTRLDCVAHFDNSPKNKYNPDPTQVVRWGDQTWEEMMIGWYSMSREIEPKKAPAASTSSSGQ